MNMDIVLNHLKDFIESTERMLEKAVNDNDNSSIIYYAKKLAQFKKAIQLVGESKCQSKQI